MISNVISIENMIESYGEEATIALLSSFSCVRGGVQKNEEALRLSIRRRLFGKKI